VIKSKTARIVMTLSIGLAILFAAIVASPRTVFVVVPILFFYLAMIGSNFQSMRNGEAAPLRRYYQPRPTDAGNWLGAPVAELDKSTCGKLLASRLRREPGLHVVIRHETPRICTDALYDPELDGQP
jgi:hypothetical protein